MARVTARQREVMRKIRDKEAWAPSMRSRAGGAFWRMIDRMIKDRLVICDPLKGYSVTEAGLRILESAKKPVIPADFRPIKGVAVDDSPLWTPEQRRLAQGNHMDAFGNALGWKDD